MRMSTPVEVITQKLDAEGYGSLIVAGDAAVDAMTALDAAGYAIARKCTECGGDGRKPRPDGWDQREHLSASDRTCNCHDSWDQCPCADGGHFPGCDCCPGGTGLCGRLPCHACVGTGIVPEVTP